MKRSPVTRLARAIASIKSTASAERFLREMLTPGELHDIALRWLLMEQLSGGATQRSIAGRLGISLCKITRGARLLKDKGSVVARLVEKSK